MKNNPLVSVIITTKNEEKHIANCLESVKNQTYKNTEIIVVDNNSTDRTKEIAKTYTSYVFNKGPERSCQRNYGVEKSKGEWILYLDADMILSPRVIEECVYLVTKDNKLIGLYIPERIVSRQVDDFSKPISNYQESFWIKARNFERSFYDGTVIDCVRFVSRKAFDTVKGFDEKMTGPEDWDFDKKIRGIGRVAVIKSLLYHNEGTFDMKRYFEKKKYYSKSMEEYINRWGKKDKDVRRQLGVFYRMVGVFISNRQVVQLLLHPMLFIATIYLKMVIAFIYITGNIKRTSL